MIRGALATATVCPRPAKRGEGKGEGPRQTACFSTPQPLSCQPPPSWRSRNSGRYSLRASSVSSAHGSNQWTVRAWPSSGGSSPLNSADAGQR